MPISISVYERKIKLTKEIVELLKFYRKALEQYEVRQQANEQGAVSTAALGETHQREGIWAKYVTATLESISGDFHGAKAITLPAYDLELDAPAEILLQGYRRFLNEMLLIQGQNSEEAEKKEITSKYVVVLELLYRLGSIALSNKLDHQHDGDRLVKVLNDFIKQLTKQESLTDRHFAVFSEKKASRFLSLLVTEHPKWVTHIKSMVNVVKLIHSNRQAVSNTLGELKQVEYALKRQLIAFLDPRQSIDQFASDWVDTTLMQVESKLLKIQVDSQVSRTLVIQSNDNMAERQLQILARITLSKSALPSRLSKIKSLYMLLNQTDKIYEIMSHLDLLMTYTSWMPILAGMINFKSLVDLLSDHSEACSQALEIPEALKGFIKGKPVERALLKHEAMTGEHLKNLINENSIDLSILDDNGLKQRLSGMMNSAVSALVRLQGSLDKRYHFIDTARLGSSVLLTGNVVPAQALVWQQQTQEETERRENLQREHVRLLSAHERLLEENKRIVNRTDQSHIATQFLHDALIEGCADTEVLNMFKMQGADLNTFYTQNNAYQGYTALHIAAKTANLAACKWLLDQGVNINITDLYKQGTPLDKASENGHLTIVRLLETQGGYSEHILLLTQELHQVIDDEKITASSESVTIKHTEKLSELVQKGANINEINTLKNTWEGDRPLHTLFVKGNEHLIQWFIGMGADPAIVAGPKNETPLQRLQSIAEDTDPRLQFLKHYYPELFDSSVLCRKVNIKEADTISEFQPENTVVAPKPMTQENRSFPEETNSKGNSNACTIAAGLHVPVKETLAFIAPSQVINTDIVHSAENISTETTVFAKVLKEKMTLEKLEQAQSEAREALFSLHLK